MPKLIDLTGQVYGRLTVKSRAENNKHGQVQWFCQCTCGNTCVVTGGHLRDGHTTSCGCLHKEKLIERSTTHGFSHDPLFPIHFLMVQRTTNPNCRDYPDYGGRGITVCERWLDFKNFKADVSTLPHYGEDGYSLDRIDNNLGYCPENVRFATAKEQVRNRRNTIMAQYKGEKKPLAEISEITGIPYKTLSSRWYKGDRDEDLVRPVKTKSQ